MGKKSVNRKEKSAYLHLSDVLKVKCCYL